MHFEPFDGEEVDAEFTEVAPAPAPAATEPPPVTRLKVDYRERDIVNMSTPSGNPSIELQLYEKRARAVALFVELPLLAVVALSDKTPPLIRLGAGLLAIWKSVELARGGAQEVQSTVTEWAQQ